MPQPCLAHVRNVLIAGAVIVAGAAPSAAGPFPLPASHPGAAEAPTSSPTTYPDETGFQRRRELLLRSLAEGGLDRWRRGYFSGGDPGKYLPGHAMAKLLLNPDDPEPARYMNDERSYKEHYHFAAVNWGRFVPLFGDRVLTPETRRKLADEAARYTAYLTGGGTENHKTMWWTTANVLPHYLDSERFAGRDREAALAEAKRRLFDYVSGLFDAGPGEWDSSTYYAFTINGLLNIYDFSPDEECRRLAKAGLDLMIAGYALKYTDGLFCGPNQRGWYDRALASNTDHLGYLWFGAPADPTPQEAFNFRYTLHAITSAYRPNTVLCHIARKELTALPVSQNNRKGNYWHGQNIRPALAAHETLHLGRHFTMGSLWDAHASQHTRFQIVVRRQELPLSFFGAHPRQSDASGRKAGIGYKDGTGRYVQSAQVGATYLMAAFIPEDEPIDHVYFRFPQGHAPTPVSGGAWAIHAPTATILLRPFGGTASVGPSAPHGKDNAETIEIFQVRGRRVGYIVEVFDAEEAPADLAAWTAAHTGPDDSAWAARGQIRYRLRDGRELSFTFNPDPQADRHGDRLAACALDDQPMDMNWPWVWGGPLVHLEHRVLRVTDGRIGFEIDFTKSLPVYRPLSIKEGSDNI